MTSYYRNSQDREDGIVTVRGGTSMGPTFEEVQAEMNAARSKEDLLKAGVEALKAKGTKSVQSKTRSTWLEVAFFGRSAGIARRGEDRVEILEDIGPGLDLWTIPLEDWAECKRLEALGR